jgi:hypothetical protein
VNSRVHESNEHAPKCTFTDYEPPQAKKRILVIMAGQPKINYSSGSIVRNNELQLSIIVLPITNFLQGADCSAKDREKGLRM